MNELPGGQFTIQVISDTMIYNNRMTIYDRKSACAIQPQSKLCISSLLIVLELLVVDGAQLSSVIVSNVSCLICALGDNRCSRLSKQTRINTSYLESVARVLNQSVIASL
jgi:hypothetical protein